MKNGTVVEVQYMGHRNQPETQVLTKVDGTWLPAGIECWWCDSDRDLREQFPIHRIIALPLAEPEPRKPMKHDLLF